jgi:predicted ester cyclase
MATDLKALCQRVNDEVLSQGNVEVIDELVDDSFVDHQEMPGFSPDKDGIKAFVTAIRSGFPDLSVKTIAVVAEGDEAWMQSEMSGTHQGEFSGIPATGKKATLLAFDRIRVKGGKVVEHWGVTDDLGMMTQLGVIPEM